MEMPPVDYFPLYSGWDATGETLTNTYCIHHPQGDVKKYANDSDTALEGSFGAYNANSFWVIPTYENGTTEDGSSGAALYNSENRVVGSLSGGGAACSEAIYDYYQKFSAMWNTHSDEVQQLKHWLDPDNSGILTLNNLDPYVGETEFISNIGTNDTLTLVSLENGWGYISGHNSMYTEVYAEHFFRNGSKYIYGVDLHVAKSSATGYNAMVKVQVWEGKDLPENLVFEKPLYLFEIEQGADNYIRFDSLVFVDRNFFVGYSITYLEPLDTFALYTKVAADSNTAYRFYNDEWVPLSNGEQSLNSNLAIKPLVLNFYPHHNTRYGAFPYDEVTLYPNPAYDYLQILIKEKPEGTVYLTIFDVMGKKVHNSLIHNPEPNFQLPIENINGQGLFIMKVDYNGKTTFKKFIKLQ